MEVGSVINGPVTIQYEKSPDEKIEKKEKPEKQPKPSKKVEEKKEEKEEGSLAEPISAEKVD